MNWKDFAERMLWTFVVAAFSNVTAASLMEVDQVKAAAMTGLAAVVQAVTLIARTRLSALPTPGEMFK